MLSPKVNPRRECLEVAKVLESIYESNTIKVQLDTLDLTKEEIANVRFFTAIQDFNIDVHARSNPFEFYKRHPDCFRPKKVKDNDLLVDELLNFLGVQSQRDKRKPWMLNSASLLVEKYDSTVYKINEVHNGNVVEIVKALTAEERYGFSTKKAHMFLRDMADLGVWKYKRNIEKLDVMSDKNTMRVALRTGILRTKIPLVSSFLDIFCYQYSLIDEYNALSWRKVWNVWKNKYPEECIESPCLMDYLIYRIIGKEFCKESLYIFKCESENHIFKWHSSRNRTCQICYKTGIRNEAKIIRKVLPCADYDGYISIEKNRFVSGLNAVLPNLKECPFITVCNSKGKKFIKLNPPKSISILGKTGWESAKTRSNEGGGGLMS